MSTSSHDRPGSAPGKAAHGDRLRDARRTIAIALLIFVAGIGLLFAPIVLGPRFSFNKYIVAAGFLIVCLAMSTLFHGVWDWMRGSKSS